MEEKIISGVAIANKIYTEIQPKIKKLNYVPTLAIILASNDPASVTYVNLKKKKAESLGIKVDLYRFEISVTLDEIIFTIKELNDNPQINGVLIQVPFYAHLSEYTNLIINSLNFKKDVDGLTATQQGLCSHFIKGSILPATVEAVFECFNQISNEDLSWKNILDNYNSIKFFESKNIIILNSSNLIGKPLAQILSSLNATVTITNSFTQNISYLLKNADIIVSATGKTKLIGAEMIKENSILIDITSEKVDGKILGDFVLNPDLVQKAKYLTPVPGGVGPITIACLLRNLV